MPATIHRPKHPSRRTKIASGTKPPPLRGKVSDTFTQQPKVGDIASQVTAEQATQSRHAKALKLRARIAQLEKELKALNVIEIPKVTLAELHDGKTGRIDAQKVADFIGVALKPLSEGLGLNYKAVHRNPSAGSFQAALRPVKGSLELLHEFFGSDEAIRAWLNTPHPDLSGATALETIMEGRADAVALILENAWNGVPV